VKSEPTLPFEDEEHRTDAAGAPSAVCRDGVAAAKPTSERDPGGVPSARFSARWGACGWGPTSSEGG
jgi:hypothetical protein